MVYCSSLYTQSLGVDKNRGICVHFHSPVARTPPSRKMLIYPKSIKSLPMIFALLTKCPDHATEQDRKQERESDELFRLSPMTKYCPSGTTNSLSFTSIGRKVFPLFAAERYPSSSFLNSLLPAGFNSTIPLSSNFTVSPGSPMVLLI